MTDRFSPEDINQNRNIVLVTSILCIFVPVLFFLPLVACKESEYGKFYANQLLLLFFMQIVGALTTAFIIGIPIMIVALVFAVMNALNANQGLRKGIPLLGNIEIIK